MTESGVQSFDCKYAQENHIKVSYSNDFMLQNSNVPMYNITMYKSGGLKYYWLPLSYIILFTYFTIFSP